MLARVVGGQGAALGPPGKAYSAPLPPFLHCISLAARGSTALTPAS